MDFLNIQNGKIVDQQHQPVYLRGVNIGGWMNMEHFLNGHSGSESNLRRVMREMLGEEKASFFFNRFLHHFFNEEDVKFLKRVGISTIRLPINHRHFESDAHPFAYLESGFERLEKVLRWCEAHEIYVILDLHSVQGWQNGDWHCDNSSRHALFWSQRHFQDRFVALWQAFARRYRDRAVIAAYNIMNEPLSNAPHGRFTPDAAYQPDWENINYIYHRTVAAIRAVDPTRIIIIEGDYYSTLFNGLEEPSDKNLMVSNHNYIEPAISPIETYPVTLGDTYWDDKYIQKQLTHTEGHQYAQTYQRPLLIGEFGLSMDYPAENVRHKVAVFYDQMNVYNRLGYHWTFWAYKGLGSMAWIQTEPHSKYMQTIKPVLAAKEALGVDFGWLAGFASNIQPHLQAINHQILTHLPSLDPHTNFRYLSQAAMSTYVADQLQLLYAQQFANKSETEIDDILASFAFDNCIERVEMSQALIRVL